MAPQRRQRESSKTRAASFSPYGRDGKKTNDDTHSQLTSSSGDNATSTRRRTLRSASKAVSASAPDCHDDEGPPTPSTMRCTRIDMVKRGTPRNSVPFEDQSQHQDEDSEEENQSRPRNNNNATNFPHLRRSQRCSARTLVLQREESTYDGGVESYDASTGGIERVDVAFPDRSDVSGNVSEVEEGEGDVDGDGDGDGDVEMAMEGAAYPGGRGSSLLKRRPRAARGRGHGKTRTMTMVMQSSGEEEDEQPPHSGQDKQDDDSEEGAEEGGDPKRGEEDLAHPRRISLRRSQHPHPHQILRVGNAVTGPSLPNLATAFLALRHHHRHVKSQNPHEKKIHGEEEDGAAMDIDLPGEQVQGVQKTHNEEEGDIDMLNTTTAIPPRKQRQANVFTRITALLPTSIPRTTLAATATATTAAVSWYLGFLPGGGAGAGAGVAEAGVLIAENVVSDSIKVTMFALS